MQHQSRCGKNQSFSSVILRVRGNALKQTQNQISSSPTSHFRLQKKKNQGIKESMTRK